MFPTLLVLRLRGLSIKLYLIALDMRDWRSLPIVAAVAANQRIGGICGMFCNHIPHHCSKVVLPVSCCLLRAVHRFAATLSFSNHDGDYLTAPLVFGFFARNTGANLQAGMPINTATATKVLGSKPVICWKAIPAAKRS